MRALVIFESMYGNTQTIAEAIADGLRATAVAVDVAEVGAAPTTIDDGFGLLVVGGPTHAHGMTKPDSRASAARRATPAPVSMGIGIREWLAGARLPKGIPAAAFDTRIKGPALLWGSAAKGIDKELRRLGARTVAPPEAFLVSGPMGEVYNALEDGEVERARGWGEQLATRVTSPTSTR
jgi:hypothetical protein